MLIGTGKYYHVGAFFRKALETARSQYVFIDDWKYLAPIQQSRVQRIAYHLLGRPLSYWTFNRTIADQARRFKPNLVLITKGAFIAPQTLKTVKSDTGAIMVNYATDDPFNPVISTRNLREGICLYDLYVCTKRAIMEDVRRAGCPNVAYVPFGYEPDLHYPEVPTTRVEVERFGSDVLFIGGADADRYPILHEVAAIPGLRLHLYGGYWDRDPRLRTYYRGYVFGREYRLALGGTKIALCLVRRSNRDGHVMRTFETPACGAFMLAERTDEHLAFFVEGQEMACFGSNEELVEKICHFLDHDCERQRIAEAGYRRLHADKYSYEDRLTEILTRVEKIA
jgi:spore maturation protein CgeB